MEQLHKEDDKSKLLWHTTSKELLRGKRMKISIIGYSGSGKSTLAGFLGEQYQVPVLYLDKVHWLPGWNERETSEKQDIVHDFLNQNSGWVIDGNYSRLFFEERMEEADKIIFMNFNRVTCLFRAWKRYITYRGRTRESMTDGCDEKIDFEFVKWILHEGRSESHKKQFQAVQEKYSDKVVVLKNQRQLNRFMKNAKC